MSSDTPRPRRKSGGLPGWAIAALVLLMIAGSLAVMGGTVLILRHKFQGRAAKPAELAREQAADRQEAIAAFQAPTPPTPEEAREFGAVLDRLGAALKRGDAAAVTATIDIERLADEFERAGVLANAGLGGNDRAAFRAGARQGGGQVGQKLLANPLMRWESTHVRRVRWTDDRSEVAVIAVHRSDLGALGTVGLKMRWWLKSGPGGWRIYDFEDLDAGMRASRVGAAIATPEMLRDPSRFQRAVAALQEALQHVKVADFAAVERSLAQVDRGALPRPMAAILRVLDGLVLISKNRNEEALAAFDAADALNPDMPMSYVLRAVAYGAREDNAKCLEAARKYTALLGPDAVANWWEGVSLEKLGRPAEAAVAFRSVLDEEPDHREALLALRRTLPDEAKGEMAERLAKTADPKAEFKELIGPARQDGDGPAVAALVAGLRKALPNDPQGLAEDVRIQVEAGRLDAAAELISRGKALPAEEDRRAVRTAYLYAMNAKGKALEAYATASDAEADADFRLLARTNDPLDDDDGRDPAAANGEPLRKLIAAHRARRPADPWLKYFEASPLQAAKDYAGAEKLLAEGMATFQAPAPESEAANDLNSFRYRRVECLYRLGKGLDALAGVGPPKETFDQLAMRYFGDDNRDGLKALIEAFERRAPGDPAAKYWRGQWHFAKAEYAPAAAAFRAYLGLIKPDEAYRWMATDRMLRALLRSGQKAEAKREVRFRDGKHFGNNVRAAVAAADGNVEEVDRLMGEHNKEWGYGFFYGDEDFARETAGKKFDAIRATYPPPKPEGKKGDA